MCLEMHIAQSGTARRPEHDGCWKQVLAMEAMSYTLWRDIQCMQQSRQGRHPEGVQVGADLLGEGRQQLRLRRAGKRLQHIRYLQLRKQPAQCADIRRVRRSDLCDVRQCIRGSAFG
jgi:hypothetical protein